MRAATTILVVVALAALDLVAAEQSEHDQPRNERRADEALELTRKVARSLRIYVGQERTRTLTFCESPLQRYSNPIAGELYAHLFIWTDQGRPQAAAAIAKWYSPRRSTHVELHSLALQPITLEIGETPIWHPAEAGVSFATVPGSTAPARFAPARLREMRLLARQFRARIEAVNRPGDVDEELRLLPNPVYRYESEDPDVLDGAIFSFVRGTDPELLLLIEARTVGGAFVWQYALAPMNSFAFQAFHGDREVWRKPQLAPPWPNTRDPAKPYMIFYPDEQSVVSESTP